MAAGMTDRENFGGIGLKVPPDVKPLVDALTALGRDIGSIKANLVVPDHDIPDDLRCICVRLDSLSDPVKLLDDLLRLMTVEQFAAVGPPMVRGRNAEDGTHVLLMVFTCALTIAALN
jgi:hypothetical protein